MNVYFVYKVLTNRIRALIIAAGYIPGIARITCSRGGVIGNRVLLIEERVQTCFSKTGSDRVVDWLTVFAVQQWRRLC